MRQDEVKAILNAFEYEIEELEKLWQARLDDEISFDNLKLICDRLKSLMIADEKKCLN